jgi:hypothetical protein
VFVLLALTAAWDEGLTVGSALLLFAYALSLPDGSGPLDPAAPLVAVGLLGVVEFGAWSLELRDGAEEGPLARLASVALLLLGALAASSLVLFVSSAGIEARPAFWLFGAAAALGLLALLARLGSTTDEGSPRRSGNSAAL